MAATEERIVTFRFKKLLSSSRNKLRKKKISYIKDLVLRKFKLTPIISNKANREIMLSGRHPVKLKMKIEKESKTAYLYSLTEKNEEQKGKEAKEKEGGKEEKKAKENKNEEKNEKETKKQEKEQEAKKQGKQ